MMSRPFKDSSTVVAIKQNPMIAPSFGKLSMHCPHSVIVGVDKTTYIQAFCVPPDTNGR